MGFQLKIRGNPQTTLKFSKINFFYYISHPSIRF